MYLEQKNTWNSNWTSDLTVLFGAYDTEMDNLDIQLSEPNNGTVTMATEIRTVPIIPACSYNMEVKYN